MKSVVVTVPVLVLSLSAAAVFLFFLFSSLSSSCNCPASVAGGGEVTTTSVSRGRDQISATTEDIAWVNDRIQANGLRMQDNVLRKGINPRTRAQQLQDLIQYSLSPSPFFFQFPIRFVSFSCGIRLEVFEKSKL